MKIGLASCAELYAEHRRTASPRKREKIAAELQRRHDEWNCPPGHERDRWWMYIETQPVRAWNGAILRFEDVYRAYRRFVFSLWLPPSPIENRNSKIL
jgi:hypothetical protein